MPATNKRLQLAVRNAVCTDCRLHNQATGGDVCVTGRGSSNAEVMVVTKNPISTESRSYREFVDYFKDVGLDAETFIWCSALKCRTWDISPSKTDQKACAKYLRNELSFINPRWVITFGAEAWFAASGHADVTKNRGKLFDVPDTTENNTGQIFPTISPAAVSRSPGLRGGLVADLHYFANLVRGNDPSTNTNDGRRTVVTTKNALRSMLTDFSDALVVAYDIETTSAAEYEPNAKVVSIAMTISKTDDMSTAWTYEVPLYHPESPFRRQWNLALTHVVKAIEKIPKRVAHNAKFDTKWCRRFTSQQDFTPTFDTIIAAALLDENRPKGLKPLAQMLLGAEPWGIDTKDLLTTPLDEVLIYNGLDTWHTLGLYFVFRQQLLEQPRLARLFQHLMMPLVQELVAVEQRGVYVDQNTLMTNWNLVKSTLDDLEDQIRSHIPETNPFIKHSKRTGELTSDGINFNPSLFLRWFLFEHLRLPIIARGKPKDDGSPGLPSIAEAVMMVLAEQHPVAKLLLDRVEWNKFNTSFFGPWSEQIDDNSRIHSTFKPWGTVTGRLSSGKEDSEKITSKKQIRGVNLQQVPRNKLARNVFGAPPGYVFVQADYSQVELRIAAFLANEQTMLSLYNTGQDIHMAMAMRMTGKPASAVTKEERKRAKAVNFGFLYGMGWRKFIATAWSNYGLRITQEESEAFRTAFFREFPGLLPWHSHQRKMASTYGRVETPMGRVRHLPDIYSPDQGVKAEAERQAINSPVQAMASDMAQLALIHTSRKFRKRGIKAYALGSIHDAVLFEIAEEDTPRALPIIKHTMENLPLERLFNVHLTVPIVADLSVGTAWGSAAELSDVTMLEPHNKDQLSAWIKEVTQR